MSLKTKTPGAGEQPEANFKQSKWRKFTATQFAREAAGSLLLLAIVATGVSVTRCTSHASHGTINPAPVNPALVLKNTTSEAEATHAEKMGFVTFKSLAGAGVSSPGHQGYGRDEPIRKDGCTASDVFLTSRPPYALKNANGGFLHVPEGA